MDGTSPLGFLVGMGMAFNVGFVLLTASATWQFVRVRDLARHGSDAVDAAAFEVLDAPQKARTLEAWKGLGHLKGELNAAVTRANLTTACIPTLALFGTVLGFYYAIVTTGSLELASSDPLVILKALMNGGVSTALATTVCGQAIYMVLGQAWAFWVAGPVEGALARIDEGLSLVRERLGQEA